MSIIGPKTVRYDRSLPVRGWTWGGWALLAWYTLCSGTEQFGLTVAMFFAWVLWRASRDSGRNE